jgi:hypothetical protein
MVEPSLQQAPPGEVSAYTLFTAIARQKDVFLWQVRLPDASGRYNSWSTSALDAANEATKRWVRVVPNLAIGGYDLCVATGDIPDPEWPELSFSELLRIAFGGDKFIRSLDHPVVQKLRGVK